MIWLIAALYGHKREDRASVLRACARGERPAGIPSRAAAIIARHAALATVMTDFYRTFQVESRQTPYPLEEIRRLGGLDS